MSATDTAAARASAAAPAAITPAMVAAHLGTGAMKQYQKVPTPPPGQGDRVFYESLFREKGISSDMALIWCIEHGVFLPDEHDRLVADYVKAKNKGKDGKGATAVSTPGRK